MLARLSLGQTGALATQPECYVQKIQDVCGTDLSENECGPFKSHYGTRRMKTLSISDIRNIIDQTINQIDY